MLLCISDLYRVSCLYRLASSVCHGDRCWGWPALDTNSLCFGYWEALETGGDSPRWSHPGFRLSSDFPASRKLWQRTTSGLLSSQRIALLFSRSCTKPVGEGRKKDLERAKYVTKALPIHCFLLMLCYFEGTRLLLFFLAWVWILGPSSWKVVMGIQSLRRTEYWAPEGGPVWAGHFLSSGAGAGHEVKVACLLWLPPLYMCFREWYCMARSPDQGACDVSRYTQVSDFPLEYSKLLDS